MTKDTIVPMTQQHTLTFIDTGPDHTNVPDVPQGQMRIFIIAVLGRYDSKVRTFCGYYLNGYPLQYDGDCPQCPGPDADGWCVGQRLDGCPTTGWFCDESNFEYENCYYRIEGDILAFAEIPQYRATGDAEPV